MRIATLVFGVCGLVLGCYWVSGSSGQPDKKPVGLQKRIPWTTSALKGFPEPPPPYKTELAFTKLKKFDEPIDIALAPGTNRFFIAERRGKIWSFENKKDVASADLVLTLKGKEGKQVGLYSFTFHPKYAQNGFLYAMWLPDPSVEGQPKGSRVSRFTVKGDPPVIDPASEKIIFEWPNGGHNGGCLRFGPDGYLYFVTGDGSGIADELNIGQDLSSVFAKMLRIDVDNPALGKAYGIPKDNPFLNTKNARPEIYAYGLRQLWRFSFDRKTGDCWGGDVGQDLWEMVYKIEKGGNYGWSVMEGNHPFRPERKKGPTPILKPMVEHSHSDFRSITGGYVYHGKRLKELKDYYIYADFDTGRVWTFKLTPTLGISAKRLVVHGHRELARTTYRIVSFGEDANGELYFLDFTGGGIHQLVKNDKKDESATFPRKLSETGLFASTKDHKVAPGVIPYSVNGELWGDHAHKERFIAIPGNGQIGFDEITYPQPSPGAPPGWRFPDGTVLVKTFYMDMKRGNPKSRKKLETRLLHFQAFPGTQEYGDQYWRGYTYVWNDEQTDAELLDEKGADRMLKIWVGDNIVEQKYHFPSRAECTLCHTQAAKFALGVNTMQMNRDHNYDGVVANQLRTLEAIGMFTKPLQTPPEDLPRLVNYDDETQSVAKRAVAYLHANCSHCHIKWGGGNADFKLLATLPEKEMGIINIDPAHGGFNLQNPKLLVPGSPERSLIYYRMTKVGLGRMPHIGSNVVDEKGAKLVYEWIKRVKAGEN